MSKRKRLSPDDRSSGIPPLPLDRDMLAQSPCANCYREGRLSGCQCNLWLATRCHGGPVQVGYSKRDEMLFGACAVCAQVVWVARLVGCIEMEMHLSTLAEEK